jgi:hypothetical protein
MNRFILTLSIMAACGGAASAWANGTDAGPGTPITTYPFVDNGFLDDTLTDDITSYGGACSVDLPFEYGAPEVFYQFEAQDAATYDIRLTSDNPGNTDFVLYILTDFNDSDTCIANSTDFVNDVDPEVLEDFVPPSSQTLYIVVDGFSDGPGYPLLGSWTLEVDCTGADCVPPPGCTYDLRLSDSFGDGWDGSFVTIDVAGTSTDYTLTDFGFASFTVEADRGDPITLSYTAGNFEDEKSYEFFEITGDSQTLLFADGPFPDTGEVFSTFCQAAIFADRFEATE